MTVAPVPAHSGRERNHSWWTVGVIAALLVGGLTVAVLYRADVFGGSSNSTTEGSGVSATQVRTVPAYAGVELAGANNVVIHIGEKRSVVVRADDNLLDRVTTEVRSGTLVIANTPGSFTTKSPMSVEVNAPSLNELTLSGSGNIVVDGLQAESLEASLPGSGTLTATGTTLRLDATVGGSGTMQLTGLVANDVHAVVSGSGSIFVTATQTLDGSVSGSGAILYTGNPQEVTKSVTGSGAITGGS